MGQEQLALVVSLRRSKIAGIGAVGQDNMVEWGGGLIKDELVLHGHS